MKTIINKNGVAKITLATLVLSVIMLSGCSFKKNHEASQSSMKNTITSAKLSAQSTDNHSNNIVMIDQNYYASLQVLNHFLEDWFNHHGKQGISLLSEQVVSKYSKLNLQHYFNETRPQHEGYEVVLDKRINKNDYRFKVWMYKYVPGVQGKQWKKPAPQHIDVVFKNNKWVINNLPQ